MIPTRRVPTSGLLHSGYIRAAVFGLHISASCLRVPVLQIQHSWSIPQQGFLGRIGEPMNTGSVSSRPLAGIALACGGYACFALQDAMVKWLVATYQVPQILFMRSLVIVLITGVLIRYRRHPSIFKSPYRNTIVLRAALMLGAWLLFYNAARHLELAELTTLYFSAPIMVMFLSILVLKEKIGPGRWVACAIGFIGVTVAANPTHSPNLIPAAMCIVAGFCWAWSTILIRLVSRSETTMTQMYATSLLFGLACALSFPWTWQEPDLSGWLLMIGLGSGLIAHSQKITVAARAMAERKAIGHRS